MGYKHKHGGDGFKDDRDAEEKICVSVTTFGGNPEDVSPKPFI